MTPKEALKILTDLYPGKDTSVTNTVFSFMEDSWFLHVEEVVVYAETFEEALRYLIRETELSNILFRNFEYAY